MRFTKRFIRWAYSERDMAYRITKEERAKGNNNMVHYYTGRASAFDHLIGKFDLVKPKKDKEE